MKQTSWCTNQGIALLLALWLGACRTPGPALRLEATEAPAGMSSLSAVPTAATEEDPQESYEWKRFSVALGAQLLADISTTMRVDSDTLGAGSEIELESDFGVDDSLFLGRLDAEWRFAKRHSLDFSLFKLGRESTRVIDRELQIGDIIFPINAEVKTEANQGVVKLAYRYAFLNRERWHFGASFGAHTMDWNTEWSSGGLSLEEDFDVLVPLPVLGVFGSWALTPRLYLSGSSEFFGLEYEQYDGFMNNTRFALEHRTFEHLALGVGLDYFLLNASVENDSGSLSAEVEYDYLGLMGFVRVF